MRRDPRLVLDEAIRATRARYGELREATARRLYAAHKLAAEEARQRAIAATSRAAARAALEARDTRRSRAAVAAARTALDLAEEAGTAHARLRASADAALEDLRALARDLAALERDRLRALSSTAITRCPAALEEARYALDVIEAERELDAEL